MNSYSEILKKYFDATAPSTNRNSILSKIGIFLIIISFVLYGFILLVPFLSLSLEIKGFIVTGLIASGEATFWIGLILAGKQAYESIKDKIIFNYNNIFKSKKEPK